MSLGPVCWRVGGKVKSGSMSFMASSKGHSIAAVLVTHEAVEVVSELVFGGPGHVDLEVSRLGLVENEGRQVREGKMGSILKYLPPSST
jgi:hypothetical protein